MWSTRAKGDRVVLMIDGNEIMRDGKLTKAFRNEPFDMRDPIRSRVGAKKIPTWYQGQNQIDAIWISDELQAQRVTFLPFFFSIGDHRGIVVDIPEEMILGNKIVRIQRPSTRRLICKRPDIKRKYIHLMEDFVLENNLP